MNILEMLNKEKRLWKTNI